MLGIPSSTTIQKMTWMQPQVMNLAVKMKVVVMLIAVVMILARVDLIQALVQGQGQTMDQTETPYPLILVAIYLLIMETHLL